MKKIITLTLLSSLSLFGFSATITVINNNDAGTGSLRQAVIDAVSSDYITFNPALIAGGNNTIVLTSGQIAFSKSINIVGLITATDTLFISGNNSSGIFSITGTGSVYFQDVVIINSNGGGAIYTEAPLKLFHSIIMNNTSGIHGGAIYTTAYTQVINSIIKNNKATYGDGGGILTFDYLDVINSEISFNTAGGRGGGIYGGQSSRIYIKKSTISGNYGGYGGGIGTSTAYSMIINTSTITDNTVTSSGGGIYSSFSVDLTVTNSTIARNVSWNGCGGIDAWNDNLEITSSIVAFNGVCNIDIGSSFLNGLGYNIFSDSPSGYGSTDQINIDSTSLNLGPLLNNGGNTNTILPGIGSVAINNGNPLDSSDSQNGDILGIRDVGAAEKNGVSSLKEIEKQVFSLYPNPTNGDITLELNENIKDGLVTIYTVNGQEVLNTKIKQAKSLTLNTSKLTNGVYFIKLQNHNEVITQKFIKQ